VIGAVKNPGLACLEKAPAEFEQQPQHVFLSEDLLFEPVKIRYPGKHHDVLSPRS
jgi:hypothetical protein